MYQLLDSDRKVENWDLEESAPPSPRFIVEIRSTA
jgi:hypothetical protein